MATDFSLNIGETLAKWTNRSPFKTHLTKVLKGAGLDESTFFGDAVPSSIQGSSYEIKVSPGNVAKIKKFIKGRQAPSVTTSGQMEYEETSKGVALYYYDNAASKKPSTTIRFTESSKKPIAGGKTGTSRKPETSEQEKVTLKIFEELLSSATPKWDRLGYKALRDTELIKIYSSINSSDDTPAQWNKHFELQFNQVRNVTKLPNNHFDTYDYDEFMDFITSLLKGKDWPIWGGPITQKDTWNPADIWLVKKGGTEYNRITKEISTAATIQEINDALKVAFNKNIIVGISLKKAGKALKYDLVNLESKLKDLPEIEYDGMALNVPFSQKTNTFEKSTNELYVAHKGTRVGQLRIGSNATKADANITYDFKAIPSGAAMLGKIPKDLMLKSIKATGVRIQELPTWQQRNQELPKLRNDANALAWDRKIKKINANKALFEMGNYKTDNFVADVIQATQKGSVDKKTNACIQIMEFAYIICLIKDKVGVKGLNNFWEDMYYYAQKKGKMGKSAFGPFAKLH